MSTNMPAQTLQSDPPPVVLVVDDDLSVRNAVVNLIRSLGMRA